RSEQALMNAATEETYLGLPPEQLAAIVQLTDESAFGGPLCTGVFLTSEWLVSAAHCLEIPSPHVILAAGSEEAVSLEVVERASHPSADVALFKIERSDAAPSFRPIAFATPGDVDLSVDSVVELAGYGLTEAGDIRELRYLAEPIVELDDESFVVNGFGANGACLGDSGGPLLVRHATGPAIVAGVLSAGSASCLMRDRYIRLDALAEWVTTIAGAPAAGAETCGGITEEGRCLYGSAFHCDQQTLVAEPCSGELACGWDPESGGFRCVEAARAACVGVDSVGACRDDVVESCRAGVLEREACSCGGVCRIDGKTGAPHCADP
ncbi:MAG TPA: S1 family peptidase, partial [Polyangiaceae bacterium]